MIWSLLPASTLAFLVLFYSIHCGDREGYTLLLSQNFWSQLEQVFHLDRNLVLVRDAFMETIKHHLWHEYRHFMPHTLPNHYTVSNTDLQDSVTVIDNPVCTLKGIILPINTSYLQRMNHLESFYQLTNIYMGPAVCQALFYSRLLKCLWNCVFWLIQFSD